jgi:hypothetical protein
MKINVIFGSIFGTALLIVVSFVSVVGYQSVQAQDHDAYSPLFAVRTQRATQQATSGGVSVFLGKGTDTNLFPSQASRQEELIQTAIKIFRAHPAVLTRLVENLDKYPFVMGLVAKYGINLEDVKNYMRMIQNDPSLVPEALINVHLLESDTNDTQPLGLSTSNPLGCFIVAVFALLPVTIVLTLLLLFFTLRILTCLNINDCANVLAQQIWDQMIQGLTQE